MPKTVTRNSKLPSETAGEPLPETPVVARVAVDTAAWAADRPYDYLVPESLTQGALPGVRVLIPFGRGNKKTEGIVLAVGSGSGRRGLKCIERVLDAEPLLDERRLRLLMYLRERLFCTCYSLVRAMLPAGFWFRLESEYELRTEDRQDALALLSAYPAGQVLADCLCSGRCTLGELPGIDQEQAERMLAVLSKAGLLQTGSRVNAGARDKTERIFSLSQDFGEDGTAARLTAGQKAVSHFLQHAGQASMHDICYYTGVGKAVVTNMHKKGLLDAQEVEVLRRPDMSAVQDVPFTLNEQQQAVFEGLAARADEARAGAALLRGVTGSGKTQIYIRLIEHVLARGKKSILLVPEIALTPRLTARFYARFGGRVAVLHSGLSVGERYDEWRRIRRGDADIVIGTRSAVFAPLPDLGLIIMDEEHEESYKSDASPRYHAREAAKFRCHQHDALLLLGSATPSVESMYAAQTGRYDYYELTGRYGDAQLPRTVIADTREAFRQGFAGAVGPALDALLAQTLANGEQAILFLNRRGASRMLSCMSCGYVPMCDHCSVAMSYHRANGRLLCHQCGHSTPAPKACPACGGTHLERVGAGTQQVEAEMKTRFPDARVLRMDSDTTSGRGGHAAILDAFAAGNADILIGTQMVAKGLDFPNVTLSAVLDADMALFTGDYRAAERAFAQLAQVAGRAGRGTRPGTCVIQTASPKNEVLLAGASQDYLSFYQDEIAMRRTLRCPPFYALFTFVLSGGIDEAVYQAARRLGQRLRGLLDGEYADMDADILGPAPARIHKLSNRYRYTLTLRCQAGGRQRMLVGGILTEFAADARNRRVAVHVDMQS